MVKRRRSQANQADWQTPHCDEKMPESSQPHQVLPPLSRTSVREEEAPEFVVAISQGRGPYLQRLRRRAPNSWFVRGRGRSWHCCSQPTHGPGLCNFDTSTLEGPDKQVVLTQACRRDPGERVKLTCSPQIVDGPSTAVLMKFADSQYSSEPFNILVSMRQKSYSYPRRHPPAWDTSRQTREAVRWSRRSRGSWMCRAKQYKGDIGTRTSVSRTFRAGLDPHRTGSASTHCHRRRFEGADHRCGFRQVSMMRADRSPEAPDTTLDVL